MLDGRLGRRALPRLPLQFVLRWLVRHTPSSSLARACSCLLVIPACGHATARSNKGNLPPAPFARRHPRANTPGHDPVVGRFGLQQWERAVKLPVEFTGAPLDVDGALLMRKGVELALAFIWERAVQQIGKHEIGLALLGIVLRLRLSISARRQLLRHDIENRLARLRAIERIERWQGIRRIGRIITHMHSHPFRRPPYYSDANDGTTR